MKVSGRLTIHKKTIGFLLLAVGITCVVAFYQYIFGDKILAFFDIGSDTVQQYLNQYAAIIAKIRAGDFTLWSSNYGFGANMYMLNMFNPMLWILYAIGCVFGNEALLYCLIYWFIGEILLSAFSAYLYLSVFPIGETAKGAAAYMYAFNGFLIIWGQHYQFGIVCILLPLLLLTIERFLADHKKWPLLTVITAVVVFNSMYIAYMILIFAALYVCFRVLMIRKFRFISWLKTVIGTALPMFLGLGMGLFSLLPSIAAIRNVSSRLSSGEGIIHNLISSFNTYPALYFQTLIDRFFSSAARGRTDYYGYLNYYEAPTVFFTTLFVILLIQYIFWIPFQKTSRKNKIIQFVFLALVALTLYSPSVGIILNGFTAAFSRYTFLYMPFFLLVSAFTLNRIIKEKKVSLIGIALAAALIIWRYLSCMLSDYPNSKKALLVLMITGLLMCAVFVFYHFSQGDTAAKIRVKRVTNIRLQELAVYALLFFLLINAMAETYSNFTDRNTITKGGEYLTSMYDPDVKEALAKIRENDTGVYRTDKLFGSTECMDSLIQGYHPVSVYNSTQNRYIIDYVNTYWPDILFRDPNHYVFAQGAADTVNSGLCGVKYVLAKSGTETPAGYKLLYTCGNILVYQSDEAESIFSFYNKGSYTEEADGVTVNFRDREKNAVISFTEGKYQDRLDGEVSVDSDGLFFAAIPYEDGWSVYVDGQKTALQKAEKGFQGVYLTAGSHSISYRYNCPYLDKGCAGTLISLLIFVFLLFLPKIKRRVRRERNLSV